jgi:hypothetical protein
MGMDEWNVQIADVHEELLKAFESIRSVRIQLLGKTFSNAFPFGFSATRAMGGAM